ncbi:hypothetical protein [Aliamphritea spongicola]|nr:hypothetical protein [Aliamphritea spongicola]
MMILQQQFYRFSAALSSPKSMISFMVKILSTLFLVCFAQLTVAADAQLLKSSFVSLPNDKLEMRFDFDIPPTIPKAYMTNSPARLVLDLWGWKTVRM